MTLPTGDLTALGKIETPLAKATAPARLTLSVALPGTPIANDWNLWVYPAQVDTAPGDVVIATAWDSASSAALDEGKSVLLLASPKGLAKFAKPSGRGWFPPPLFTTVYWSPLWCPEYGDSTMGILCDPKHPALARFPTAMHTDWQWYEPLSGSVAMVLDDLPAGLRPIIAMVDNFTKNRRLGLVFEAQVGKGKLMVSSIDLQKDIDKRLVSRQLRASLLAYMRSDAFRPKQRLEAEVLDGFFGGQQKKPGE